MRRDAVTNLGARVWVGEGLADLETARVAPHDHGFTVGDGCFEALRVLDGVPQAVTRHLARLQRSCRILGFAGPADALVRQAVAATIAANPGTGRLRLTVTAGPGPLGSGRWNDAPTLVIVAGPATVWPPVAKVAVCPWLRNDRAPSVGAKTTSYVDNVLALRWAKERDADEALFANTRGDLCEGTGSNVVLAVDGVLVTPPLSSGCLPGVTRDLLLEELGDLLVERDVPLAAVFEAPELFLTSATRDVQPIVELDGEPREPGPLTAVAAQALAAVWRRSSDP